MKKDLCELVVVIDESGSMQSVVTDTIGGFNTFLETHQKLPGEAKLTLVKFDTTYNVVYNGVDVREVKPLDKTTYSPGGMTALLDSVGKAIDEVGKRYDSMKKKEKPGKVIFLIITDGQENSSKEYTKQQIKEKTKQRQDVDKFEFVFMGADQDAWSNAQAIGISNSVNFVQKNMNKTIKGMTYYSSNMRTNSADLSMDNFNLSELELDAKLDQLKKSGNDKKV